MKGNVWLPHRIRMLHRWWAVFASALLLAGSVSLCSSTAQAGTTTGDVINVNASSPTGIIQPTETGQTMEVASDEMNGAWRQEVQNRELQTDQVSSAENSTPSTKPATAKPLLLAPRLALDMPTLPNTMARTTCSSVRRPHQLNTMLVMPSTRAATATPLLGRAGTKIGW